MWECFNCGSHVENIDVVKCPHCGYRIFYKKRPPIVRKITTE